MLQPYWPNRSDWSVLGKGSVELALVSIVAEVAYVDLAFSIIDAHRASSVRHDLNLNIKKKSTASYLFKYILNELKFTCLPFRRMFLYNNLEQGFERLL